MSEDNKFTVDEGFEKTYAHYLLFKKDSEMLNAVLKGLFQTDENDRTKYLTMFDETLNKIHVIAGLIKYGNQIPPNDDKMTKMLEYVGVNDVSKLKEMQTKLESNILTNKKTLDVIHEVVITYLPTNYFPDQLFNTNVNANLLKSLKQYLKKDPTITPSTTPSNTQEVTKQIEDDKVSKYIYDEDKIVAVAAFYEEAHNVDKEKAILSVAYAYEQQMNAINGGRKKQTRKPRILKKWKTQRKK